MLRSMIEDVFKAVVKANLREDREAIPHSDAFFKHYTASTGIDQDSLSQIISILKESHKILAFEIQKEDRNKNMPKIEGYVDADVTTVRKLLVFFQTLLVDLYEEESGRRQMPHLVIKELFPRIHMISNTPLGHIANKAIMLDEYEKLLQKNFNEFSEEWKEKKLKVLIEERGDTINSNRQKKEAEARAEREKREEEEKEKEKSRRAVDSAQFKDYSDKKADLPVEKLLNIYGVEFFLRVHLRKYDFVMIKDIIEKGIIRKKEDLQMVKVMIQKIRNNVENDSGITDHLSDLYRLDRVVSLSMHSSVR